MLLLMLLTFLRQMAEIHFICRDAIFIFKHTITENGTGSNIKTLYAL